MGLTNTEQFSTGEGGRLSWQGLEKQFWRCTVCNDIHYGTEPPETCPTCGREEVYVEADPSEAEEVMKGLDSEETAEREETVERWRDLAEKNDDFRLNPDEEMVSALAEGVTSNEEDHGRKYCPCQVRTTDPVKDLGILCPCNFETQPSWEEKGECWCGLFVEEDGA